MYKLNVLSLNLSYYTFQRGKFRPRLMNLIKSNTAETVTEVTTLGFEYLPDIEKAIKKLSELKGVGPATASGLLQ